MNTKQAAQIHRARQAKLLEARAAIDQELAAIGVTLLALDGITRHDAVIDAPSLARQQTTTDDDTVARWACPACGRSVFVKRYADGGHRIRGHRNEHGADCALSRAAVDVSTLSPY